MIALFLICIVLYGVFGLPAFIYAKRRNAIFWSDIATPILVVSFWVAVTASGYGHQSLSHIVEVPIALVFSLISVNTRVFVVDKYNKNYRSNSYIVLGISIAFVFILRTFMPYMPE